MLYSDWACVLFQNSGQYGFYYFNAVEISLPVYLTHILKGGELGWAFFLHLVGPKDTLLAR